MRFNETKFNEWWAAYWRPTGLPEIFYASMRELARDAWIAGVIVEREANAKIADKLGGCQFAAKAIRARSDIKDMDKDDLS